MPSDAKHRKLIRAVRRGTNIPKESFAAAPGLGSRRQIRKQKLEGIIPLRKQRRIYVMLQRAPRGTSSISDALCSGYAAPQAQFGGSPMGCSSSANFAIERIMGSENLGPTICSPTGSLAAVRPAGTLAPGSAAGDTRDVGPIQSM